MADGIAESMCSAPKQTAGLAEHQRKMKEGTAPSSGQVNLPLSGGPVARGISMSVSTKRGLSLLSSPPASNHAVSFCSVHLICNNSRAELNCGYEPWAHRAAWQPAYTRFWRLVVEEEVALKPLDQRSVSVSRAQHAARSKTLGKFHKQRGVFLCTKTRVWPNVSPPPATNVTPPKKYHSTR